MENQNKRLIITEGIFDKEFLEKVLPNEIIDDTRLIAGQGYSSSISKAKSISLHSKTQIFLIMDSDTSNEFEINEKKENILSVFRMLGKENQIYIFFFIPELEVVFLQDDYFREKHLTNILKSKSNQLLSPSQLIKSKQINRFQLLEKIGKSEIESLRKNTYVKDLINLIKKTNTAYNKGSLAK